MGCTFSELIVLWLHVAQRCHLQSLSNVVQAPKAEGDDAKWQAAGQDDDEGGVGGGIVRSLVRSL